MICFSVYSDVGRDIMTVFDGGGGGVFFFLFFLFLFSVYSDVGRDIMAVFDDVVFLSTVMWKGTS